MTSLTPVLDYQVNTGAAIRWNRIFAFAVILIVMPFVNLLSSLFISVVSPATTSSLRLLYAILSVISPCLILLMGVMLATCHQGPPRGAGMSWPRWAGLCLTAAYSLLSVFSAALSFWVFMYGAPGPSSLLPRIYNLLPFPIVFLYLTLLVALCMLMRRISKMTGRHAFFIATLFAAGIAAVIRIASLAFTLLMTNSPSWFPSPASLSYSRISLIYSLTSNSLNLLLALVYGPILIYLALTSASRAKQNPAPSPR